MTYTKLFVAEPEVAALDAMADAGRGVAVDSNALVCAVRGGIAPRWAAARELLARLPIDEVTLPVQGGPESAKRSPAARGAVSIRHATRSAMRGKCCEQPTSSSWLELGRCAHPWASSNSAFCNDGDRVQAANPHQHSIVAFQRLAWRTAPTTWDDLDPGIP